MTKSTKTLGGGGAYSLKSSQKLGFTLAEVLMAKRTSGIENEVLYSRESEPKEPSNNIIKRCAFTLAEVLITLAVIGVVAALTIPTVVHKYQQKQFYTAFMKTYNTLQNAYQMSIAENGDFGSWNGGSGAEATQFVKFFGDYLKIKQIFTRNTDFRNYVVENSDYTIQTFSTKFNAYKLTGENYGTYLSKVGNLGQLILEDGTFIGILVLRLSAYNNDGQRIQIAIDINGPFKKPNTFGRDIFLIHIDKLTSLGKYALYPAGLYGTVRVGNKNTYTQSTMSEIKDLCNSGGTALVGAACGARLLLEGKMDY